MELETLSQTKPDLVPEYCQYQDEGCELAQSCLNCPFPSCIYDKPRGRQRLLKNSRDCQIVTLFKNEGKGVPELAVIFGISRRTVQRALKNYSTIIQPGNSHGINNRQHF